MNAFRSFLLGAQKVWDQFCMFTELPGFRFMTSAVRPITRLSALCIFLMSALGAGAQLAYLVRQYLLDRVQTSSRKYRLQLLPLPIVYLCHPLNGTGPLPLLELCRDAVFLDDSPDLSAHPRMRSVVPLCHYQIKAAHYGCALRCKWTSHGFCVEAKPNIVRSEDNDTFAQLNGTASSVEMEENAELLELSSDFDIRINFNATLPHEDGEYPALALVYLRFFADARKSAIKIPLVGAAHMIMERDSRNFVQLTEILRVTHTDLAESQLAAANSSYEFCVWRTYSSQIADAPCASEYMANYFANASSDRSEFTGRGYNLGIDECALKRAQRAEGECRQDGQFNRFTAQSQIQTSSAADREAIQSGHLPNLEIRPNDAMLQETLHQPRAVKWKMMSEFGGTLALYVGFTLMSALEALVFFTVTRVRHALAQTDPTTLVARRHPPIRRPRIAWRRKAQSNIVAPEP